jgi:hypothetical protein
MAGLHRFSCQLLELSTLNTRRFLFQLPQSLFEPSKNVLGRNSFNRERTLTLALKSMMNLRYLKYTCLSGRICKN